MQKYDQRARIALASASPRRRELLESIGLKFDIMPANIDENVGIRSPKKLVKALSYAKATAAGVEDACVIGSDTVVFRRGKLYGKPHTIKRAEEMLGELQGKWHTVYTGVSVIYEGKAHTFVVRSRVKFKRMSDAQIKEYVSKKQPLDKAGAYGIQDGEVVQKYRGSYSNIVGLPLEKLTKIMIRIGAIYGNDRPVY